jgi:hypothetical protein
MSGELEMEIERILNHTNKLYDHIMQNLFLTDIITESEQRIARIRRAKNLLKYKFLTNAAKAMLMGNKKKNLINTHGLLMDIKVLKGISEGLRTGAGDFYELIGHGKSIIAKYEDYHLNIFKLFLKEYHNHLNIGYEKLLDEFVLTLRHEMFNLIDYTNSVTEDIATYVRL